MQKLISNNATNKKCTHPGGKLRELGADKLSDDELLAVIIGAGIPGNPAEKIAHDILNKFGSFKGMANQPLAKFLEIKGLGERKVIKIAAIFEIARRCVDMVVKDLKEDGEFRKEIFGE
jgi:DNA repair protein RadC